MTKTFSCACIIFFLIALLLSFYTPLNYTLFSLINQAYPSQILWFTLTNTGGVIFLGCALFIVLQNRIHLLTNALLCAICIHYSIKFTKNFFAVLRPEHTLNVIDVNLLGPALDLQNYSMPSGHTASAFMALVFIISAHRLKGIILWMLPIYAVLIAVSRIGHRSSLACRCFHRSNYRNYVWRRLHADSLTFFTPRRNIRYAGALSSFYICWHHSS